MLLTRLYLRNFRVYEDELELEVPPGLVGIYGPNGSGKSTLLEAILFSLWGKARTAKEEIRSAGVGGDCVTEVEFEHEGHLYVVRRSLAGANNTVRAEATCDGLTMSEGVRDTGHYVHSVLGMDDGAFRASVFAEQKQLAAFSSQSPAERRRLVLQLLGITPLDSARDAARKDARGRAEEHRRLREMLPDVAALATSAADAEAAAGAAEAAARDDAAAAGVSAAAAAAAAGELSKLDGVRQAYEGLVVEGRSARSAHERAAAQAHSLEGELAGLAAARAELSRAERAAAGLVASESQAERLGPFLAAWRALASHPAPLEPAAPDPARLEAAQEAAAAARDDLAGTRGLLAGAQADLDRAQAQLARSAELSVDGDCPLCGQALGAAFAQVQSHRSDEVAQAESRLAQLERAEAGKEAEARRGLAELKEATTSHQAAADAHAAWQRDLARHADADAAWAEARGRLAQVAPDLAAVATLAGAEEAGAALAAQLAGQRQAELEANETRGRLTRQPDAEAALQMAREEAASAEEAVATLRDKVQALAFDPAALDLARARFDAAQAVADSAAALAQQASVAAARDRSTADAEARHLAAARAQHAKLGELESEARHLGRVADLLSEFRNTVVASVGPRLATQAAELFSELTDHEYDALAVDPETYELQISDAGRVYGLDRFSGSEVDLANLALRVAISEHVRFQSGGSVGLLVLDEVFGPLDEERKTRMLLALEHLRGRFRQVLVVTHDSAIKEQLPGAIEVVKRPGRRATARVLLG